MLELQSDGTFIGDDGTKYDKDKKVIPFTKNINCPRYRSKKYNETYGQYKEYIDSLVKDYDFHKGDMGWSDWSDYCMAGEFYYETSASWPETKSDEEDDYSNDEDSW